MPDSQPQQHSLEYKVALLKYLIDTKEWLLGANVERFWGFVGDTFAHKAAPEGSPNLTGKQLEALCKDEVDAWGSETGDNQKKRRPGHEKGSQYDTLMKKWIDVWDAMMIDYWKAEVEAPGPNFHQFVIIPVIWRDEVEKKVLEAPKRRTSVAPPDKATPAPRSDSTPRPQKRAPYPLQPPQNTGGHANHPTHHLHAPYSKTYPVPSPQTQMQSTFEYEIEKLRRVVESAKERAREVGKESLAHAVQQIFEDSMSDFVLRRLLEKILASDASKQEKALFANYVKLAKKKLRLADREQQALETSPQAKAQHELQMAKHIPATGVPTNGVPPQDVSAQQTPNAQAGQKENAGLKRRMSQQKRAPTRPKVSFPNMRPSNFPQTSIENRVDSAHASEQRSDKEAETNAKVVRNVASGPSKTRERKSDTESSSDSEEAEEADLAEAERASKRRRRAESDDDSGSYHPKRGKQGLRKRTGRASRQAEDTSPASSPLSSHGDTDVEATKEAYVEELVHRQSAEASKRAIEAAYGPVSPTIAGDARSEAAEDWDSMPSPMMEETIQTEQQATAGADNGTQRGGFGARSTTKVPSPPPAPEQTTTTSGPESSDVLTPDDSSHAYRIITGAAAEAVAPAISRLEEKIDALITSQLSQTQQPTPPPQLSATASSSQRAAEPLTSSTQELLNLANALSARDLLGTLGPEETPLVAQLIKNAAEAAIHAADAARKAGEIARDVSAVLMQLGAQGAATTTGQPDQ